jgi:NTE family protein
MHPPLADGFTLALGGGGGRGWAHIGVARALAEAGLRPSRIVGTSMGAIVGAGIAAGVDPREMERMARETSVYRLARRGARLALMDPRPLIELMMVRLGDPRIEAMPIPLAVSAFDLVSGRPTAVRSGPLGAAIERSIAVPLFFPPCEDGDGVWCDAGPWEAVPVSLARAWSPDPVVGVWVDVAKPWLLSSRPVAAALRQLSARLGVAAVDGRRLSARRYFALLAARWADPVHAEEPDLLIRPRLGLLPAWHFARVRPSVRSGYLAARLALDGGAAGAG